MKRIIYWKSIALALVISLLGIGLLAPTAMAYPTGYQDYQFFVYIDGNNNNQLDVGGHDTCISDGRLVTVAGVQSGINPFYQFNIPNNGNFVVYSWGDMFNCYQEHVQRTIKAPWNYKILDGSNPDFYFTSTYINSPSILLQGYPVDY
jgi:hypothetical protein